MDDREDENTKIEDVEGNIAKTDSVKTKRVPPKAAKKMVVNPPKKAGGEFDWPKKNYFEVTCVAAESSGSGQRMVMRFISRELYFRE